MRGLFILFFGVGTLTILGQNWQQMEDFPGQATDDGSAVSFGEQSYYGFGSTNWFTYESDWWLFDHPSQTWMRKASFPGAPLQYTSAVAYDASIFFFGGYQQGAMVSDTLYQYQIATDSWAPLGLLPMGPRFAMMAIKVGHRILVGMGNDGQECYTDLWWYTPLTHSWEPLTSFPGQGRQQMQAFFTDNEVVIGSGRCGGVCLFDWWQYSFVTKTWTPYAAPEARFCSYQNKYDDAQWFVMGGGMTFLDSFSIDGFSAAWWALNKTTGSWTALPDFPGTPKRGGGVFRSDHHLHLISGLNSNGARDAEVWRLEWAGFSNTAQPTLALAQATQQLYVRLAHPQPFEASLFNVLGGEIATFQQPNSRWETQWTLPDLSNGLYVVKVAVGETVFAQKIIIAK